nr:SOS response-associated peptidase family protein [Tianweitania sp.]
MRLVYTGPNESKPLFVFAGIWISWTGVRRTKESEVTGDMFAFLTTEPHSVFAPIHPKVMPVILTNAEEIEVWMRNGRRCGGRSAYNRPGGRSPVCYR